MAERDPLSQEAWAERGACLKPQHKNLDFFVDKSNKKKVAAAKAVCNKECPVVLECFAYAYINDIQYGIWGGKFHQERIMTAALLKLPTTNKVDDLVSHIREIRKRSQ